MYGKAVSGRKRVTQCRATVDITRAKILVQLSYLQARHSTLGTCPGSIRNATLHGSLHTHVFWPYNTPLWSPTLSGNCPVVCCRSSSERINMFPLGDVQIVVGLPPVGGIVEHCLATIRRSFLPGAAMHTLA